MWPTRNERERGVLLLNQEVFNAKPIQIYYNKYRLQV